MCREGILMEWQELEGNGEGNKMEAKRYKGKGNKLKEIKGK